MPTDKLISLLAARRGHFRLESGHHGELWLDLERLCLQPERVRPFAVELASLLKPHQVEAVCGPLNEGAFVALMVAEELGVDFTYAERIATTRRDGLFPVDYRLPGPLREWVPGRRVAIVTDVINAGSAVRGTLTDLSDTSGGAGLNCLSDNLDESLALFVEMVRSPRFQEDRLALAKEQALQDMKKRNDDAEDIESREWGALLYGESHFTNRFTTEASIKGITQGDLVAFHQKWYHPANMVAAVSGSFSRGEMIQKLEKAFAAWPGSAPSVPPVPTAIAPAAPGLYRLQKDVNQGRVSLGLPTVKRDSPDIYALEVMNEILGGSGFGSRIMRTVRSNEGLAYSAGSGIGFGVYYPGRFRAGFQSKSRSVAYATQLVLGEIRKMRDTLVTAQELDVVKSNLITTFPSSFGSAGQSMSVFASDEFTRRDPLFWPTYRDRIRAVTAAEVQRVARAYLLPEKLIVVVVGDQKEIDKGDATHEAALALLAPGGNKQTLALRNPLTMKR